MGQARYWGGMTGRWGGRPGLYISSWSGVTVGPAYGVAGEVDQACKKKKGQYGRKTELRASDSSERSSSASTGISKRYNIRLATILHPEPKNFDFSYGAEGVVKLTTSNL